MLSENSREIINAISFALDVLSSLPFKVGYITGLGKIYMKNT
ncbi:hypothetical protein [Photorhabdus heterorhabditis]|nr:hypothetical protein [Photorhabdus heterorhabditis]